MKVMTAQEQVIYFMATQLTFNVEFAILAGGMVTWVTEEFVGR